MHPLTHARRLALVVVLASACGSPAGVDATTPTASAPATASAEYSNPVFTPVLADPSVIRADDGSFYAYGTEDDWGDGEGPRQTPIIRSRDLVKWDYVGEAFAGAGSRPDWKQQGFLWAPDIARIGKRYVLYYSLSVWGDPNPGIGVATADSPEGPFSDRGKILDSRGSGVANSIDPMFYVDQGKPYLFWGSFNGIYGIRLTPDGMATTGKKFRIAGNAYEAPYIIRRNGAYWFFGSLGSCCEFENSTYHVAVGRADRLRGPYVDAEGTDLRDGEGTLLLDKSERFVGPGHNAVVHDDAGDDWIVYHAIEDDNPTLPSGANRRPMLIDPLVWTDGWPTVKDQSPSQHAVPAPVIRSDS